MTKATTTTTEVTKAQLRGVAIEDILRGGEIEPSSNRKAWGLINRFSEGNNKLKGNTSEKFLIWNLPSIQTCPFATPLCMSNCYARKSERQYPQVRPFRELNFRLAQMDSERFKEFFMANLEYMMSKPSYQKADKVYFRLHESGDMFSQDYLLSMIDIMKKAKRLYGDKLSFTFYTKSIPYLTGLKLPDNCKVYYSVWSDTLPAYLNIAKARRIPMFEAVTPDKITHSDVQCIGDCSICKKCYDSTKGNIKVAIH